MMAKVDQFLDQLINYEKENIHAKVLDALEPYLTDPQFDPEFVRSKSGAAAGLCSWVINVVQFYNVYIDVLPKRLALQEANDQLCEAQENLAAIVAKETIKYCVLSGIKFFFCQTHILSGCRSGSWRAS